MSNLNTYLDRNNKIGRHPNQLLAAKSREDDAQSSVSAMIAQSEATIRNIPKGFGRNPIALDM